MKKEVSIVLSVESKNYRKLAQTHYNLTDEQMKEMDVHHNPPRHQGGRNIPEHLFVYHYTLHAAVHGDDFTKWARKGSAIGLQKLHSVTTDDGKSAHTLRINETLHFEKTEDGKSKHALMMGLANALEKNDDGKSINLIKAAAASHSVRNDEGKSVRAVRSIEEKDEEGVSRAQKLGKRAATLQWEDPDHPELGTHNAGNLVRMQRKRGYACEKENRRRVL